MNEWIEINIPWIVFANSSVCISGVVVITQDNKKYLIGDVNESLGVCGCCEAFEHNTIIKSYCVVWEKEE